MRRTKPRRVPVDLRGLTAAQDIFRIAAAIAYAADIDAWLANVRNELRGIARDGIAQLRECGGDVVLRIHDGCPVACIGDAPFAYVNAFAAHVNVGFFYGAALNDSGCLLIGSGKRMRHVKVTPQRAIEADRLHTLVRAAHADLRTRLAEDAPTQEARD